MTCSGNLLILFADILSLYNRNNYKCTVTYLALVNSKYTLERMFTCQLLESAKDELSFRSVVKDLKTKSSLVHIVLLNPNSWCCSGYCSEDTVEPFVKINLHPVVKVLFSQCYDKPDSILRSVHLDTLASSPPLLPIFFFLFLVSFSHLFYLVNAFGSAKKRMKF